MWAIYPNLFWSVSQMPPKSRSENESWSEIVTERIKFFVTMLACLIVDGLFILVWYLIHWGLHYLSEYFQLVGFEYWVGVFLRCLLEIPVIIATTFFVIIDIIKIGKRLIKGSKKSIEIENSKEELETINREIDTARNELESAKTDLRIAKFLEQTHYEFIEQKKSGKFEE
jgi:phosphotransferase system  glucose/maltose/N-acetylglucosamine-specific IIC component